MRRWIAPLFVAALLGSCASSAPMAVTLTHSQDHGLVDFTASGPAVDEAVVCPGGSEAFDRLEDMEGSVITDDDWAGMFDTAMAEGSVAQMMVYEVWTCADGSGEFTVAFHNVVDFSFFEFEGVQDVGTWEVVNGTGDYERLAGSGTVTLDWDSAMVTYEGGVEA